MLNKIISESNIQKAKKLIDKYDNIAIITHVSPDGDAIGSSLALFHFLFEIGKQPNVIVPNSFPQFLSWLKGSGDIVIGDKNPKITEEVIVAAELIFCLDFNALKRSSQLAAFIEKSKAPKVMVDHHPHPEDFCDVTISHPEISSCSELIFRLICRMGMFEYITKNGAECIYTGMMTDTGAFTFNSNSPAIYYIISELLRKGINKDAIYARIYNNYTESRVRLQGFVLYEKMKIFKKYKTALITLSKEEQLKFHREKGDTEGFVNIPLTIRDIVFSVFIREETDANIIKLSFRSKGDFPTNKFASETFNGGGHLNASGGEFYGTLEEAVALFEKSLPHYEDLLKQIKVL